MRNSIALSMAVFALFPLLLFPLSVSTASKEPGPASVSSIVNASMFAQRAKSELNARVSVAVNAGIPAEDVAIIVSRSMKRNDGADAIKHHLDLCIDVQKQGLPVGPVLDRIEQGLAKGVSKRQVAASSHRFAEKLEAARPVVNGLLKNGMKDSSTDDHKTAIEAVARVFEQNVSTDAVTRIGAAVMKKRENLAFFASAVNSTSYLMAKGVSGEKASRMIVDAVGMGSSEKGLHDLARRTAAEVKRESVYDGTDQRPNAGR